MCLFSFCFLKQKIRKNEIYKDKSCLRNNIITNYQTRHVNVSTVLHTDRLATMKTPEIKLIIYIEQRSIRRGNQLKMNLKKII